jgi:uncharacterized C2H2 Zn-finger protein
LKWYISLAKEENKPYNCPNWDARFAENISLKGHISLDQEKNKSYKCPICDVIFAVNISLNGHISSGHEKNLTNAQIVMQDLQKTLTWNDILLQHIKENKPYKCSICDVIFAENMNLKWHISSAHEENKPIWSILHHIDPFWSNLIKFEQVWTSLSKFDPVWSS